MDANDGLPQHIRGKYKRRVETLERSAENFKQFKLLARDNYRNLSSSGSLKRTKESSGVTGFSSDAVRVRPRPRKLTQKQLNFAPSELSDS